jgi:hypothetical protein
LHVSIVPSEIGLYRLQSSGPNIKMH